MKTQKIYRFLKKQERPVTFLDIQHKTKTTDGDVRQALGDLLNRGRIKMLPLNAIRPADKNRAYGFCGDILIGYEVIR